jgi:hypothetical protein
VGFRPVLPFDARLTKTVKLRTTPQLWVVMRAHAYERQVSVNRLVVDILQLWASEKTDPTDPLYAPEHIGVRVPGEPHERYAGYVESLRFGDAAPPVGSDPLWHDET